MADFPTLSIKPSPPFEEAPVVDPTIRSRFEGGAIVTRARFTAVPKRWEILYQDMVNADKDLLKTFETTTVSFGADPFNWTAPDDTTYVVKFAAPIRFVRSTGASDKWQIRFSLVENTPNSDIY